MQLFQQVAIRSTSRLILLARVFSSTESLPRYFECQIPRRQRTSYRQGNWLCLASLVEAIHCLGVVQMESHGRPPTLVRKQDFWIAIHTTTNSLILTDAGVITLGGVYEQLHGRKGSMFLALASKKDFAWAHVTEEPYLSSESELILLFRKKFPSGFATHAKYFGGWWCT